MIEIEDRYTASGWMTEKDPGCVQYFVRVWDESDELHEIKEQILAQMMGWA